MLKKILTFALLLPVSHANAIVNLQDVHSKPLQPGFHGAVALEFSGSSGNNEKSSSTIGTQLHWKKRHYSNILLADYSYGEANQQVNSDEAFLHLRHIHDINQHYAWELFNQHQHDRFARLTYRGLLGGGFRYKQVSNEYRLIYGVGAFYKQERLSDKDLAPLEPRDSSSWNGNIYLIAARELNSQSNLYSTLYYQPELEQLNDYRVLLQAGIKVKVAESLSLKLSINGEYDSKPPAAVEDYNLNYRSGLEYRF